MVKETKLYYLPGKWEMIEYGDYVCCSITGEKISLDQLRYWNVEKQEAYASADIATRRFLELSKEKSDN